MKKGPKPGKNQKSNAGFARKLVENIVTIQTNVITRPAELGMDCQVKI